MIDFLYVCWNGALRSGNAASSPLTSSLSTLHQPCVNTVIDSMQLCDCWKPPEGNFYFQMFLLILVLITHSLFCFFHLSTFFFSSSRKTKTFRRMILNSGFLFFIFLMFSSERRRRRRKKCIGIRSCKLNRHHAFAVYFPRESVTSDDILMSVLDPEIHSSHSNLKILSIFQKSLFMQLPLNI